MNDKLQVTQMQIQAPEPLVLTEADLAQINARARLDLMQVVFAQLLVSFVVALLAWVLGGLDAGLSALAGSAAYVVPNFLFALRLFLATFRPSGSSAFVFLAGEFLKVGASVGLLWLLAHVGGERVVWLAVIAGLVAALKGYMLVLMFGKRAVSRPTNS
jgi:ATP synthase protein I